MKIIDILEQQFIKEHPEATKDQFENRFNYWLEGKEIGDILELEAHCDCLGIHKGYDLPKDTRQEAEDGGINTTDELAGGLTVLTRL